MPCHDRERRLEAMPRITIDGTVIEVAEGTNVVAAAESVGKEIPHYCYHPGLSVAGNCRMCLVEVKALSERQATPLPKLQIGCNITVQDGMVVETDNDRVNEARRSVLEFLLINHPIDCPVCDQSGECKLQDYYMDYGGYGSRVGLADKVHKQKAIAVGPDIMLDQERCILCTRCVRFLDEFTETHELTVTERGDRVELSLATGATVDNDYATNVVDICPVGALTSRQFRFQSRVWYLKTTPSVCTGCATGCNIDVHSRDERIYRIKPRYNDEVNGYWMCDFGRTTHQDNRGDERLVAHLQRESDGFAQCSAEAAVARAAAVLKQAGPVAIIASAAVSLEEGLLLRNIAQCLGEAPLRLFSGPDSGVPDDGRLISSDRYPNRRGLLELGFVEDDSVPQGVGGLIIVRADPASHGGESWKGLLGGLGATVVAHQRVCETVSYADVVLALASHFEADATFKNKQGLLQQARASVPPPAGAIAGWQGLATLLVALGGARFSKPEEVLLVNLPSAV